MLTSMFVAVLVGVAAVTYPAPGLMILVGEHRLHLHCSGRGEPTVVMDAGLGGNSLDWVRVQPKVAEYTRVCAYDRAGYGWSEVGPLPRTSERIANELHTLLHTAGMQGPFLLVGHSFGGYNVRLFASLHPDETAGLILVESAHEDQFSRLHREGVARNTADVNTPLLTRPSVPGNIPKEVRPIAQSLVATNGSHLALHAEMISLRQSAVQVRRKASSLDTPTLVISRGLRVWPQTAQGDRMEVLWREWQRDLAVRFLHDGMKAQRPHMIAERSGHYVHLDQPELVVSAIRHMVESVRR